MNDSHITDIMNCENMQLSTEEVLKELEIVKADKGNEVIIDNTLSAKREYAALSKAAEIIAQQAEREDIKNAKYDEAIEYFENIIARTDEKHHLVVWEDGIQHIQAALNALKTLKDLQTKVKQHDMIAER